jgi:prepilin-type N-terminal cleavage/methylation domain-containing protein
MESPRIHVPVARGFTLVEMIVVLTIIATISTIALTGQNAFNRTILLTDTAYSVALSIREAQSLGLSSRAFGGYQNAGYGVYLASASPTTYRIFADVSHAAAAPTSCPTADPNAPESNPGNCLYDGTSEDAQTFLFSKGFVISDFCGIDDSNSTVCASSAAANAKLLSLHILFLRPNTEAIITGLLSNSSLATLSNATIYIKEPSSGNTRCVYVSQVGQVSVLQTCP